MSDKVIDWSLIPASNDYEQKHRPKGWMTYQERMNKAWEEQEAAARALELRKAQEMELRPVLLEKMLSKSCITVLKGFQNPTETVAGMQEDEEDDGFYYKGAQTGMDVKFQEVMENIPAGELLEFKQLNNSLGQLIFKGLKSGKEYAIYKDSEIMFLGQQIRNPGLDGLLFNTDINKKINL